MASVIWWLFCVAICICEVLICKSSDNPQGATPLYIMLTYKQPIGHLAVVFKHLPYIHGKYGRVSSDTWFMTYFAVNETTFIGLYHSGCSGYWDVSDSKASFTAHTATILGFLFVIYQSVNVNFHVITTVFLYLFSDNEKYGYVCVMCLCYMGIMKPTHYLLLMVARLLFRKTGLLCLCNWIQDIQVQTNKVGFTGMILISLVIEVIYVSIIRYQSRLAPPWK